MDRPTRIKRERRGGGGGGGGERERERETVIFFKVNHEHHIMALH